MRNTHQGCVLPACNFGHQITHVCSKQAYFIPENCFIQHAAAINFIARTIV